mgnify:FL=1
MKNLQLRKQDEVELEAEGTFMKKYDDYLEKIVAAVFVTIGIAAILINLHFKEWQGWPNWLDAIKDIAGLIVVLIVFLMTSKLFNRNQIHNFVEVFETKLIKWIEQNEHLVCLHEGAVLNEELSSQNQESVETNRRQSKYDKRSCMMLKEHSNVVTGRKTAKNADYGEKAVFVYLPSKDENGTIRKEFEFRFNSTTFKRQPLFQNGTDLKEITSLFLNKIEKKFKTSEFPIELHQKSKDAITVTFSRVAETEENAQRLVDVIEFVKTMVLALA